MKRTLYAPLTGAMVLLTVGVAHPQNPSEFRTLRVADLDGDGRLDQLEAARDGSLAVSLSLGGRQYEHIEQELPAVRVADVLVADLDRDERLDLYLVSPDANVALLGDGTGGFREATATLGLADAGRGRSAEWLDIDEDGELDVLLHNEGYDVIFWGQSGGIFERNAQSVAGPAAGASVVVSLPNNREPSVVRTPGATTAGGSSVGSRTPVNVSALGPLGDTNNLQAPPSPSFGGAELITSPFATCASSLLDQSTGNCGLQASSTPSLGLLTPLSVDWFIDAVTGDVGLGTTTPTTALDVDGTIRSRSGGVEFPDGSTQTRAAIDLYVQLESLDQEQTQWNGSTAHSAGSWQSVTPEKAGQLTRIELYRGDDGSPGTVNIFDGQGAAGTLLASESVAAPTITGWQEVVFSSPPTIVAGTQFTVQLLASGIESWHGEFAGNPYAGGTGGFGASTPQPVDFAFRTYLSQPTPALSTASSNAITTAVGLRFPGGFDPDLNLVGSPGNFLAFGHSGVSEDSIGYANNTFYFHDSPGGADITEPDVSIGGRLGVGTTTPNFTLEVNGDAAKPGGGSWTVASDARLKTNVADLQNALETLLELRGVTFEYKDPAAMNELEGERIGFIAQEVEQVLPDWVEEASDGYKRLTIRGFEALAVEAFRAQQERIDLQDRQIELLRKQIESLSQGETVSAD